ncbi:MAG TPA: signal peptidase II [Nitrospira sp.]|nr:signal peptidase II [Nitrospira sp.]
MPRFKQSIVILLLLFFCVGCDRLTKDAAQQYLALESPQSWFHDTVRLEYAENTGAFLSLGSSFSKEVRVIVFQVFPAIWIVGLALYLLFTKIPSTLHMVAWCLVLSGGVGNLLDRVFHDGRVVDFMNLGIGNLRTGIFNVADVCITVGVALLVLQTFQRPRQLVPKNT